MSPGKEEEAPAVSVATPIAEGTKRFTCFQRFYLALLLVAVNLNSQI